MLTKEDLEALRKPFAARDHEFIRGFTYLTEEAITSRIEEVDPAWSFEIDTPVYRGENVTIIGRLTINGVTRCNTGMQTIQYLTEGQGNAKGYKIDAHTKERVEIGEPEKGATTDALKRCARLFGIGRYILDMPSGIKDEDALTRWLNQTYGMKPANVQQMPTAAAKAALGTPSSQRVETDDVLPTTPVLQPANVVKVSVKPTGEGKRKELILTMDDSKIGMVRAYSRKLFIDAGWIDDSQWTDEGIIELTPPIPVMLKRDAKTGRYWELAEVVKPENPFLEKAAS